MALRLSSPAFRRLALAAFVLWAPHAAALFGRPVVSPVRVFEYQNAETGHYFLTATADEMTAIEAGAAGPGWARTGFAFDAYPAKFPQGASCPIFDCGTRVSRFYAPLPGPNTHFYTADADEAGAVGQPGSGWLFEREEFRIPVPDANGQCGAFLVPVFRLYNDRARFNDTNHRYVADPGERDRMIARGWIDEGVRFCSYRAVFFPPTP
jgi:hypothetical protein